MLIYAVIASLANYYTVFSEILGRIYLPQVIIRYDFYLLLINAYLKPTTAELVFKTVLQFEIVLQMSINIQ